ncbi:MAG: agmatine/peptidylarginine deiminase, partial [Planctomycetota bacterium]
PHLVRAEIEAYLRETLGARHVLWLGEGIAGDDTDGHVDDMVRFVGPTTVVAAVEDDTGDENHAPLADNLRRLRAMADQDGRRLEVVPLPMPAPLHDPATGKRLPATHANFYVTNRSVIVPVFGGPSDTKAIRILRRFFPDRLIAPLRAEGAVVGLGAWHCLTKQLPR